uniref:Metalloendopeptidase n=1 Tax=Sinocyclocheilus anshuiensis TaxID=1608454 RepID=A0A671NPW5_9TELE
MLYVGIFVGLVLESWSLPVQVRTTEYYCSYDDSIHIQWMPHKCIYFVLELLTGSSDKAEHETCGYLTPPVSRGFPLREGDILGSGSRSVITCLGDSCRWPRSVDGFVYVPYIISPIYETGIMQFFILFCIIIIVVHCRPHSCWSYLGMIGGSQTVSLQSPGCMWSGVAAHELMHALGFVHEQSRSDRDHHVSILWENIIENQRHNFKKYETNNLNTAYDYSSVMHYGRYAFSEDGGPTIIPKPDPYTPIGQRDGPSLTDIHKINILYNCGRYSSY